MYVTYCRDQMVADVEDTTEYRLNATGGTYRPTWLIRTFDWQKVPGKEAENGYHALSYCWEQSGKIVKGSNNQYDCIDDGLHQIVDIMEEETDQEKEEHSWFSWWRHKKKTTSRPVTFEGLLKQLCEDFQIDYLWYDKVCIDQTNEEIKLREIKEMHRIYGNARYTLAFVPDLKVNNSNHFHCPHHYQGTVGRYNATIELYNTALWWRRSWTLEEVMMSKRMLVVGKDMNLWEHRLSSNMPATVDNLSSFMLDFHGQGKGSINQALFEAHYRTSSRDHDKIFALANIFPDVLKDSKIQVNYRVDADTVIREFYRNIATSDLSILCFGSPFELDGSLTRENSMRKHNLPSWAGIGGRHVPFCATTVTLFQSPHFIDDSMCLHIKTKYYYTMRFKKYSSTHNSFMAKLRFIRMERLRRRSIAGTLPDKKEMDEHTALRTWRLDMKAAANCHATHYHELGQGENKEIRPLSLTEECDRDDEECLVLPILHDCRRAFHKPYDGSSASLAVIAGYRHGYFLPIFKKLTSNTTSSSNKAGRYKAIGIFLNGDLDEAHQYRNLDQLLHALFESSYHEESKEFIIQ